MIDSCLAAFPVRDSSLAADAKALPPRASILIELTAAAAQRLGLQRALPWRPHHGCVGA